MMGTYYEPFILDMSLLGVVSRVVRHGSAAVSKVLSKPQAVSFTSLTANSSKLTPVVSTKITSCSLLEVSKRFNSYDPYTDVEAPSPYKNKPMYRIGYKYKYYTGGKLTIYNLYLLIYVCVD